MTKENLSVSLPPKTRSMVEKEAKRGKRSRSAVVREALHVYFGCDRLETKSRLPKNALP